MSENTVTTSASGPALFGKSNYMWMLLGVVVIALGMFLMAGAEAKILLNLNRRSVQHYPYYGSAYIDFHWPGH
ncbi:DUF3098 domain-containing protein [Niabella sp. W65]|nr:DUF3098 domain-containing protein [Niabella sp. W65]MCH7368442.1 DUF3098 domain-containing protein [Niabella sp. W65]